MAIKSAFPPSVDRHTQLLILGSLPGDVSIRQSQYYAHRGNAFWHLIGDVLGEEVASLPYPMRLARLLARGVGLWDVIESATRPGSLDSAISGADIRDLATFIGSLPAVKAIAFNGRTAALHGRGQLEAQTDLTLIDLPSSSGAYARMSREQKALEWRVLRRWIV